MSPKALGPFTHSAGEPQCPDRSQAALGSRSLGCPPRCRAPSIPLPVSLGSALRAAVPHLGGAGFCPLKPQPRLPALHLPGLGQPTTAAPVSVSQGTWGPAAHSPAFLTPGREITAHLLGAQPRSRRACLAFTELPAHLEELKENATPHHPAAKAESYGGGQGRRRGCYLIGFAQLQHISTSLQAW